jgi:hypothetical protein
MKIIMFINVGNIPMTEEDMLAKISKSSSFHEGTLEQSQDNRSVWIVRTKFSDEFKNHYTKSFWKWLGDGVCKQFEIPVYVSIYAEDLQRYPRFQEKRNVGYVDRLQEPKFDFSEDDISTDHRFW